jgi:hypothetical protein
MLVAKRGCRLLLQWLRILNGRSGSHRRLLFSWFGPGLEDLFMMQTRTGFSQLKLWHLGGHIPQVVHGFNRLGI